MGDRFAGLRQRGVLVVGLGLVIDRRAVKEPVKRFGLSAAHDSSISAASA